MTIRCITFDLDDTLWAIGPVIEKAERAFYAWLDETYPSITAVASLDALVHHRRAFMARHPALAHDITRLRRMWLAHLAEEHRTGPELVDSGFEVYWNGRNTVDLFEEVPAALESLQDDYIVGAITNGNADVDRIGIGEYFRFVVTSADAGAAKPDPTIFEAALTAAGVQPHETVHVGDDPRRDVVGAQDVGMHAVWVNPTLQAWPGGQTPLAVIRHLGELAEVLERF